MRRRWLAALMSLGLVISAMGFTGIYAALEDQATTGTIGGDSAPLPGTADIQIAWAESPWDCPVADFSENLTAALTSFSDVVPGDGNASNFFCIRNVGVGAVAVTLSAIDLETTELDCTGDEELAGDLTCTAGETGSGELDQVMKAFLMTMDCASGVADDFGGGQTIAQFAAAPVPIPWGATAGTDPATIAPGGKLCLKIDVFYPPVGAGTTASDAQLAQSDAVSWRFAFNATATE